MLEDASTDRCFSRLKLGWNNFFVGLRRARRNSDDDASSKRAVHGKITTGCARRGTHASVMIQASRLYPPRVFAAETYKRAQCDASADGCDSARVSSDALAGARDPWDAFGDPRLVLASASLTSPELTGTASSASLTRRSFVHRPRGTHAAAAAACLLYTSPSPRDATLSRMPSSA